MFRGPKIEGQNIVFWNDNFRKKKSRSTWLHEYKAVFCSKESTLHFKKT